MRLHDLLRGVPVANSRGALTTDVGGIQLDSRKVQPGDVYVARRGGTVDGHRFVSGAVQNGAVAVVVEDSVGSVPAGTPVVQVQDSDDAMARMAANFHGHPTQKMGVVGITGTNGKTSTAFILDHLLRFAQKPSGLIGTVVQRWGNVEMNASMTTPDALLVQSLAAQMAEAGVEVLVLEVSSHAIVQRRVEAVDFSIAVFTNLSQDHLDYHGTMDAYRSEKGRLFSELLAHSPSAMGAVMNLDDEHGEWFREQAIQPVLGFSMKGHPSASLQLTGLDTRLDGCHGTLLWEENAYPFFLPLLGRHNAANALAAFGCGLLLGLSPSQMVEGLRTTPQIPGRVNRLEKDGVTVVVDYAHTEDAIRRACASLRALNPNRLWCVFGCGGDRDRDKRGGMGAAAVEGADAIVLTSDNPRSESPEAIATEVMAGWGEPNPFDGDSGFHVELNRGKAIGFAIEHARPGDVVLVAGKGHEQTQELAGEFVPFDDRTVAWTELNRRGGAQ